MRFLVIEIQVNDGQLSHIVTTHETVNEAESKFYQILSYAAVSAVEKHGASLLTDEGACIRSGFYSHVEEQEETNETDVN